MQSIDKINILKKTGKTFFTVGELQRTLKLKKDSLKKTLGRLKRRGLITRLCRGLYVISGQEIDVKKLVSQIYTPYAYISFESALSTYGILNQIPYAITMATYKTTKVKPFLESEIVLRKIKKNFFFGYKLENNILIAEPEKALLDTLYMKSKGLATLNEEELNLSDLSKYKFLKMNKSFPKNVQKEAVRLARKMKQK